MSVDVFSRTKVMGLKSRCYTRNVCFFILVCKIHTEIQIIEYNFSWQPFFSETSDYAVTSYNSFKLPAYLSYSTPTAAGIILLSTLSVIRHLICGNNQNWLLNLNLIYKTLWTGVGSELLISMLEKFNQFHLAGLIHWCY